MLRGKRVFVTGGAGFIGSTLARELRDDNELRLYDNLRRDARVASLGTNSGSVTLVQGDVLDADAMMKAVVDFRPTHIVHAAAIAGIDTVGMRPADTLEINILGTVNALRAAREVPDLERVVCFSTSEIFGPEADNVGRNSPAVVGHVGEPRWVYAVSKLASEHLAFAYYKQFGVPTVAVRPFNVYGPGQVGEGALSNFVKAAVAGKPLVIRGDGQQIRSWCYVDDMVRAVLIGLEHANAVGKAFNVGNVGATLTISELAEMVVEMTGGAAEIVYEPSTAVDVLRRIPDVSYPKQEIGFEAQIGLEEGLRRTINYVRSL